jgi:hypothetical protein
MSDAIFFLFMRFTSSLIGLRERLMADLGENIGTMMREQIETRGDSG